LVFGPPKERSENFGSLLLDAAAACIPFVTGAGLIYRETRLATKAVNLPAWRKIAINMAYIIDKHGPGVVLGRKTAFPATMTEQAIEAAVREAYRYGSTAGAIVDGRVAIEGFGGGLNIKMWVNLATKTIETAYPVFR
jgi:hypothetical protein